MWWKHFRRNRKGNFFATYFCFSYNQLVWSTVPIKMDIQVTSLAEEMDGEREASALRDTVCVTVMYWSGWRGHHTIAALEVCGTLFTPPPPYHNMPYIIPYFRAEKNIFKCIASSRLQNHKYEHSFAAQTGIGKYLQDNLQGAYKSQRAADWIPFQSVFLFLTLANIHDLVLPF